MVYIISHTEFKETNIKNIGDNIAGAHYIPTHNIL